MFRSPWAGDLLPIVVVLLLISACRDVSQPALDSTGDSEILVPVEQEGAWGYITGDGRLALEPRYERAYRFVNDRALVRQDGRYGFIDPNGTVVIPTTFAGAGPFSDGIAPVRPDSLWGFIDRTGTMVVAPRFRLPPSPTADLSSHDSLTLSPADSSAPALVPSRSVSYFSDNRARIRHNGRWGYVDRTGTTVIPPRFARAGRFRNGLARVQFVDGSTGYVRPDGTVVWPSAKR